MKKINIVRKIIAFLILILFVVGLVKLFPTFISLTTEEGRITFQNNAQNLGMKGVLSITTLEICKILLIFLPGEPIELVAGMCYGAWGGLLIIYIGVIISNFVVISLVKKYGKKFVNDIVSEEKRIKVEEIIKRHPSRAEATLIILYFLPALPKDLITYVVSLSSISIKRILLLSIIARFPAVFSSVLAGSRLLYGDIKSVVMVYLLTYVFSGFIVYLYNRKSKEKGEENE